MGSEVRVQGDAEEEVSLVIGDEGVIHTVMDHITEYLPSDQRVITSSVAR